MKICYIADALSLHTQRWVNYFANKGHEVHLISWRGGEGYAEGVKLYFMTRLAPRIWPVGKYLSALLWLVQARRLVRKIKPDVIDAHFITTYGYLGVASGFHPLNLSAWGSDILIQPKQNPLFRFLTKYTLKKADHIICDSELLNREIIKLGADPGKINIVYNGIDTQQFNPQEGDESLRARLNVLEMPTIICFRHLRPVYNVEMLIKAIPLILGQVPEAKFIIGGDGEQRGYLQDLANSLGVSDSIRFVGWIPHNELPKYLASSDVYVSTSLSDSTSLSLQEAMACELAPVVTDIPANQEWITDGENSFVVPINDTHMLAEKIVYLLKNKEARERFGKAGRKIIKERAEYEKEMGKMEKIYQGLLEK